MIAVGIDPGVTGAIARIDVDGTVTVVDMPMLELARSNGRARRVVDAVALADTLSSWAADAELNVMIETQQAMPEQGVSSTFAIGTSYGIVLGVVGTLKLRHETIRPNVWKRQLRVPAGKDGARKRASELFPQASGLWALKG